MVWSKERQEWVTRPEGARALERKEIPVVMEYADAVRLASTYLNTTRCAGGRIQAEGLRCPHCDSLEWDTARVCPWAGLDGGEGR